MKFLRRSDIILSRRLKKIVMKLLSIFKQNMLAMQLLSMLISRYALIRYKDIPLSQIYIKICQQFTELVRIRYDLCHTKCVTRVHTATIYTTKHQNDIFLKCIITISTNHQ